MFRFHRTARVSRGKFPEAAQWAKEVAGYINTKYAPVSVQAYAELFGMLVLSTGTRTMRTSRPLRSVTRSCWQTKATGPW